MNQMDWDSLANLITEAVLARLESAAPIQAAPGVSMVTAPGRVGSASVGAGPALAVASPGLGRPASIVWVVADLVASDAPFGLAMELAARAGAEQWVVCPRQDHVASALARMAGLGAAPGLVEWESSRPAGRAEASRLVREADRLLVLGLGWSQARALADADDRDFAVRLLLDALTAGRPVRLLRHADLGGLTEAAGKLAAPGPDVLPGPLARKTRQVLRDLEMLGIEWVEPGRLADVVASVQVAAGSVAKTTGGLVTARTVAALQAEGRRVLELPRGTVVTPLARDEARRLGVELKIVEG